MAEPKHMIGAGSESRRQPRGLRPAVLVVLYMAVGLTPLLMAAVVGSPPRNAWRELSSGLAMVGFAMMLVQFLLSGRFEQVSGKTGIDLTMRFHQLAAWSVLAFILLHPILYAVPRLQPNPADGWSSLNRMFASPGLRTGVIAWWLTILLVVTAVWRDRLPFRYEVWRLSHGVLAGAIAALGMHHTLGVGTHAAAGPLAAFWIVLTILALLSLVFVYLIKPLRQLRSPYRVVANDQVATRMWRVAIEPEEGPGVAFAAGQFGWVNLGHSPFSLTEHPFSMSSSPMESPCLEFTIKESGDFTDRIGEVQVGTRAFFDGPHGNFTLAGREARRLVFIAGGVGFAPVMSILRQLRADRWPHRVTVVYGNRVTSQVLYREEIEAMGESFDLDLRLVLSEPPEGWTGIVGELTPDVLRACLDPADPEALYFVCGPTVMMNVVEDALIALGVPGRRIVSERFKYD